MHTISTVRCHLVGDLQVLLHGLLEHPGGEVRRDAADVDILGEGGAAGEVGLGQELHQRLLTASVSVSGDLPSSCLPRRTC